MEEVRRERKKLLPGPPPGWRPGGTETAAGMMAAHWTEEDDRIMERFDQERKAFNESDRSRREATR
jgi:hypothetical protein